MSDTVESVMAMRVAEGYKVTFVAKILGARHTIIFEDGRISKVTYCNTCGSALSIGTKCVSCGISSGPGV